MFAAPPQGTATSSTASNSALSIPPLPPTLCVGYSDQTQVLAGVAKGAEGLFYWTDYLQTTTSFAEDAMNNREFDGVESAEGFGTWGGVDEF